jgi:regulatory protein
MKITGIEPQKKKGRKNIFLDGAFAFGVSDENIMRFGVRIGDDVTHELVENIRIADEFSTAKKIAIRALARTMKTEKEIRKKLSSFGFGDTVIEATIAFLNEHNFLNDEKYGEIFVHDAMQRKPRGKKLVFFQLQAKGVAKELAYKSTERISEETERINASMLAEKKMELLLSSRKLTIEQRKRRIGDFLLRRGFASEIVFSVIKKLFS